MTRYRCSNPECRSDGAFLAPEEVVAVPEFGGALYHAHQRQGALLDPLTGLSNVARIGGPPDPYPLPCGPVDQIDGPCRLRLRRTKGYRKPPGAVNVARPTKWGNPIRMDDREAAAEWFAVGLSMRSDGQVSPHHVMSRYPADYVIRRELRGKDLACWCPLDAGCHADALLSLANELTPEELQVRMVEFQSRAGPADGCA